MGVARPFLPGHCLKGLWFISCRVACLWTASLTWTTVTLVCWRLCSCPCPWSRPARRRRWATRSSAWTPSTDRCRVCWTAAANICRNMVSASFIQHVFLRGLRSRSNQDCGFSSCLYASMCPAPNFLFLLWTQEVMFPFPFHGVFRVQNNSRSSLSAV